MATATAPPAPPTGRARAVPALLAVSAILPALATRAAGAHPAPLPALLCFGAAVVGASFLLAWAAEAAQLDISGGLAIAGLALIAVLPEYAVDLYYAYTAGHAPEYTQYAAANMTGSNRLLLGVGWPLVVLVGLWAVRRRSGRRSAALRLHPETRVDLGFLLIAGVAALAIPVAGRLHLAAGVALLGWFAYYLFRAARGEAGEPELIGTAAALGALRTPVRRTAVLALFAVAAAVILASAEPFANSLIDAGTELGIDRFLLVQWLAPLASEAPEFIIATIFAARGNATAAIATLISSKVNQWTLLLGSLPVAYLAGGGSAALPLDARQSGEVLLTATQTLMGVALLLSLRFHRWTALALLALFVAQFPLHTPTARAALCAAYAAVALAALVVNRRRLPATLAAPFRRTGD